jgi:hypothetical protein
MDQAERDELQKSYDQQITAELQRLAEYRLAVEQEFAGRKLDDPETAAMAKDQVVTLVPDACKTLAWLINHADSENIRKDISKWVLECAMKQAGTNSENDALATLMREFTKTPVNDS